MPLGLFRWTLQLNAHGDVSPACDGRVSQRDNTPAKRRRRRSSLRYSLSTQSAGGVPLPAANLLASPVEPSSPRVRKIISFDEEGAPASHRQPSGKAGGQASPGRPLDVAMARDVAEEDGGGPAVSVSVRLAELPPQLTPVGSACFLLPAGVGAFPLLESELPALPVAELAAERLSRERRGSVLAPLPSLSELGWASLPPRRQRDLGAVAASLARLVAALRCEGASVHAVGSTSRLVGDQLRSRLASANEGAAGAAATVLIVDRTLDLVSPCLDADHPLASLFCPAAPAAPFAAPPGSASSGTTSARVARGPTSESSDGARCESTGANIARAECAPPLGADDVEGGAGCAVRHRLAELEPAVLDLVLSCTAAEVPHALREAADRTSGRASKADPSRPHRAALPDLERQLSEVEALEPAAEEARALRGLRAVIDTALVPDGAQEQLAEAASSLCALATDPRAALEEFVRLAEAAASEPAGLQLPQLVPLLAMLYSLIGSEGFVPQPPPQLETQPPHPIPTVPAAASLQRPCAPSTEAIASAGAGAGAGAAAAVDVGTGVRPGARSPMAIELLLVEALLNAAMHDSTRSLVGASPRRHSRGMSDTDTRRVAAAGTAPCLGSSETAVASDTYSRDDERRAEGPGQEAAEQDAEADERGANGGEQGGGPAAPVQGACDTHGGTRGSEAAASRGTCSDAGSGSCTRVSPVPAASGSAVERQRRLKALLHSLLERMRAVGAARCGFDDLLLVPAAEGDAQRYQPLLPRLVERMMKGDPPGGASVAAADAPTPSRFWSRGPRPLAPPSRTAWPFGEGENEGDPPPPLFLVFVLGGVTLGEVRALLQLRSQPQAAGWRLLVGSTHFCSPREVRPACPALPCLPLQVTDADAPHRDCPRQVCAQLLQGLSLDGAEATLSWFEAAECGDEETIEALLLHGQPIDARDNEGATALHHSTRGRQLGATRLLLARNADPRVANSLRRTPLHEAAECNAAELAQLLSEAGCPLTTKDVAGKTAFDLAEEEGNDEVCG